MKTGNGSESKKAGRKRTGSLVEKRGSFYLVVFRAGPPDRKAQEDMAGDRGNEQAQGTGEGQGTF